MAWIRRFGLRVVNEGRLEGRENADKFFHRHVELCRGWIFFAEGVLDHLCGQIGKGERTGPWGVDEELAIIQMLTALLVIEFGIYVDAVHSVNLL